MGRAWVNSSWYLQEKIVVQIKNSVFFNESKIKKDYTDSFSPNMLNINKNIIRKALYFLGGKAVGVYSKFMFQMSVARYANMPMGAKILVANHPTTTDPFVLTSYTNGQASVLIKDILFDIPIFGKYLHFSGHIPVINGKGTEAFEKALVKLNKGITIVVFIEGDLSKFLHKVNKPKTGAVRLALASKRPIIPIGISVRKKNIRSIKSIINGVSEWGKWYFKGPYAITFGKPINLKGNIKNWKQVENLSKWLANKISLLQKESAKRLINDY